MQANLAIALTIALQLPCAHNQAQRPQASPLQDRDLVVSDVGPRLCPAEVAIGVADGVVQGQPSELLQAETAWVRVYDSTRAEPTRTHDLERLVAGLLQASFPKLLVVDERTTPEVVIFVALAGGNKGGSGEEVQITVMVSRFQAGATESPRVLFLYSAQRTTALEALAAFVTDLATAAGRSPAAPK